MSKVEDGAMKRKMYSPNKTNENWVKRLPIKKGIWVKRCI